MRKTSEVAMLLLLTMVVMAMGCCTHTASMRLGDGNPPLSDREFFRSMEAGYESSFPDSEEVLFTKGYCSVEGWRYATFAWRDDQGKLRVVLNGYTQFPHREFPIIGIARIGEEILGENCCWIPDQKGLFTYASMGTTPDEPIDMFRQVKRLKHCGINDLALLLPRR